MSESTGEFDLTLTVPGDVESLRPRLVAALERLGYRVPDENPIQAKCKPRGWGLMSSTVLDYPKRVTLSLKPVGEGAALVTFDYEVLGTIPPAGWRRTLAREAEAAVALATQSIRWSNCQVCGAEATTESRFCRQCGAPQATDEPAEVEVLRLTAHAEAARLTMIVGAIILAVLFSLILVFSFPMTLRILALLGGSSLVGAAMFFNIRRLHRALYPSQEDKTLLAEQPKYAELPEANALLKAPPSVTENTTDLLRESEEALPARPRERETT